MKLACVVILAALLLCECVAVKHQSKLSSKKSTSRRSLDDDDDDSPSVSSKRTKGKATPKAPLKRMGGKSQLVKWGDKKKEKSRSGRGAAGTSLKERLESIASQSTNAYKNAFRQVKALRSSAFESMLLKATWPNDDPVPSEILNEIIRHSIPAFKYGRSSASDDPYHMTLHKLWMKMNEKDWRTIVKSLYILHLISRDSSQDVCDRFAAALKDMVKSRNPKNPEQRYFDLDEISIVDKAGDPFADFIYAYAEYVVYRLRNISGKSEQLKGLDASSSEKTAVAMLKKAKQCVTLGLRCAVTDKKMVNLITGHVLKAVAVDLRDMWKLFAAKLAPLADQGSPYGGAAASVDDVKALLKFYEEKGKDVNTFLARGSKTFDALRLKLPSEAEGVLSAEQVAKKIEALMAVQGGWRQESSSASHDENDDDDEDEEEEEDDEEEDGNEGVDDDEDDEDADDADDEEAAEDEGDDDEDDDQEDNVKDEDEEPAADDEDDEGDEEEEDTAGEDDDDEGNEGDEDNDDDEDGDDNDDDDDEDDSDIDEDGTNEDSDNDDSEEDDE